jgi:hypothetical protein
MEGMDITMPPDVWGPIFWDAMHIASLAYPVQPSEADKAGARAFFESLAVVIPCPICRVHYAEKIRESPINVDSKGELIYWVWDIHNQVNVMLKKPTVTLEQFLERMRTLSRSRIPTVNVNATYVGTAALVGIAVGAGGYWAYQKWCK